MMVKVGFSKPIVIAIHLAAMVPMLSYGVYHLLMEIPLVGGLLTFSALILVASLVAEINDSGNDRYLQVFILCCTLSLTTTCYFLGVRGVVFVFPLLSAYFYAFPYSRAIPLSILAAIACMGAALHNLEPVFVSRIALGLGLTVFFNASFAALLNKQKKALIAEANQDYLTGIANRRSFNQWLNRELPRALQTNKVLALLYIDLDDFKRINDSYGHPVGDKLLIGMSERLQISLRASDVVEFMGGGVKIARLAGDEFAVVLTNLNEMRDVETIVKRLLERLNEHYQIDKLSLHVSTSIGIAIAGVDGDEAESLLRSADAAMYQAKTNGKKRYQFFNKSISSEINLYETLERGIQHSLSDDLFYLLFMPIYDSQTLKVKGVEVLIRSHSPYLQSSGPDKFIPAAERCGLIYDVDLFVVEASFKKMVELKRRLGAVADELMLCINLSAKELLNEDIVNDISCLLGMYEIEPARVEFEITETSLVGYKSRNIEVLKQLKQLGVRLSLDDFGTGYTAFNQLSDFPVDTLKIDKSFVDSICEGNNKKSSMVNVIAQLANLYELDLVAEGVETEAQFGYLKQIGCDYLQGYYLSKPLSWEALMPLLEQNLAADCSVYESIGGLD